MPEAELPCDDSNERLRRAHLHNGQAEATALFASYFALAGVGAALLVAWAMLAHGDLPRLITWLGAVVFAHWWTYRRSSDERRVGQEWVSTCRFRGWRYH